MNAKRRLVLVAAIVVLFGAVWPAVAGTPAEPSADMRAKQVVVEMLDRMPLLFVPGQVSSGGAMGYVVRGREASIWLTEAGIAYRLQKGGDAESKEPAGGWVVALDLVGATPTQPVGGDQLPTTVSYFKGPKDQWRTGLPSYGSVRYHEPWPGVDLVVSGTAGELESTFVVRPGADPGLIRLAYRGATEVRLELDGSLVADTPLGEIREQAPVAYQEIDGERVHVAAGFELEKGTEPGRQAYRFRLDEYDPAHELVIDPVTLIYCGYIGGAADDGASGIAVDAFGSVYVSGSTHSNQATFPVAVGPDLTYNGDSSDVFVAKVSVDGTSLEYCGYIGGSGRDWGSGIAVDAAGNAYVTGGTYSTEATFPVVVGPDLTYNGLIDAFVARVNPAGTALDFCGYIGGSNREEPGGIDIDGAGNAYITGFTRSTEATFPVTVGPDLTYNGGPDRGDAFVAKVDAAGTHLDYCGYIGGSGDESASRPAVDSVGNAYITGLTTSTEATFPVMIGPDLTYNGGYCDAYVARISADGTHLDYAGYIGGSDSDTGSTIAIDFAGNAYVTGQTQSTEATFPVTVGPDLTHNGGYSDAYVARIKADGTHLDYCGYIGGDANEAGSGIAVDNTNHAYVTGFTRSTEATFPVKVGPDLTHNGDMDGFIASVSASGAGLRYCGYIGGTEGDSAGPIAVDSGGNAYVAGSTGSTEVTFPVTVGPDLTYNGGGDAFVAKVSSINLFEDGFESGDTSAWSVTVP